MSQKKPKLYYLIFIVIAIGSALGVVYLSSRIVNKEKEARQLLLERANRVAATELNDALNNYATLLSGVKSFVEINDNVPSKARLRAFIELQHKDLEMDPPFSVTYVDSSHIIVYDLVFSGVEEVFLKGQPMQSVIGAPGVKRRDSLMLKKGYYASNPTNLLEGGVGLPLGFAILDENGNSRGYMTSVALFAPIVDRVYKIIDKEDVVLSFRSSNGNYFDRARSYNSQKLYSSNKDPEYFKNFEIAPEEYVYSEVPYYNNTFTIGTAFKEPYKFSPGMYTTSLIWYLVLLGFMFLLLTRFYIYKRKNDIIATQKRQLIELVATKNKFFNIIAHDLRSPLSSVVNFLDILRSEGTEGATNKKIVDGLGDSSKNSLTLLDNLLKWSKVQTGKINYSPVDLNLLSITKDQLKVQQYAADSKRLRIDLDCSFNEKIKGDRNLIANVIRNLISNAIKFSYEGHVVAIEISKLENEVSFSVEDTGVGIPQEHLDKLFDITEVTTQRGTNNEKGSGLGLVLSRQFIEMHNGKLDIESKLSVGTITSFTLPL